MPRDVVLIETYWNVNEGNARNEVCVLRINRNILECKYPHWFYLPESTQVLIETYWNVNAVPLLQLYYIPMY